MSSNCLYCTEAQQQLEDHCKQVIKRRSALSREILELRKRHFLQPDELHDLQVKELQERIQVILWVTL
jgi:hypothetical protein